MKRKFLIGGASIVIVIVLISKALWPQWWGHDIADTLLGLAESVLAGWLFWLVVVYYPEEEQNRVALENLRRVARSIAASALEPLERIREVTGQAKELEWLTPDEVVTMLAHDEVKHMMISYSLPDGESGEPSGWTIHNFLQDKAREVVNATSMLNFYFRLLNPTLLETARALNAVEMSTLIQSMIDDPPTGKSAVSLANCVLGYISKVRDFDNAIGHSFKPED